MVLFSSTIWGFEGNYSHEAEVPEPLLFDLVRRINSDKGELEVNSLIVQDKASELGETYIAPEIEYVFANGKAIEIEFPTLHGQIKTFKSALQFKLPDLLNQTIATQIIYENFLKKDTQEATLLLIFAKRINDRFSTLNMLGSRLVKGQDVHGKNKVLLIFNHNLFYNYDSHFDFGLELNLRGIGSSFEELLIMPQFHALLAKDFKIQAGFGIAHDGYTPSPISAFRLIKEFN